MAHCSVCGGTLLPITDGVNHGVRCRQVTCLFNFQDQKCPDCGKDPARAEHPHLGVYHCYCPNDHMWFLTSENDRA